MKKFGILLFGCARSKHIDLVLKSLKKQNALQYVDVWLDGYQGVAEKKVKCMAVRDVVKQYPVNKVYAHNGSLGLRKMILQALSVSVLKYDHLMILEDDCFPTRNAVEVFQSELEEIEACDDIFSIYGHPFLVSEEREVCTRFQGWGWGTTSKKMIPFLDQLIKCFSMTEESYLNFTRTVLKKDVISQLDITYPRQPTQTLVNFFAWDETLALLTVLAGKVHKKTKERTIYNFGMGEDSTRFNQHEAYKQPPYNLVWIDDVWDHF